MSSNLHAPTPPSSSGATLPRVCFIGGGNMAQALIKGMLHYGFSHEHICVVEINVQLHPYFEALSIPVSTESQPFCSTANVIVLAIKPQAAEDVLPSIAPYCQQALVISILAGTSTQTLQKLLHQHTRVIRAMPNTPAMIGQGATGLYAPSHVHTEDKQTAQHVLSGSGLLTWVTDEQLMNAITAISGSGPAYFFYLMESMIEAGVEAGLSVESAQALTIQTALGAASIAKQSTTSPQELRRNVTSPNGTTQAATDFFDEHHLKELLKQGILGANARSKALANS